MAVGEWSRRLDVSTGLKSSQESASVSLAKAESFIFLFTLLVKLWPGAPSFSFFKVDFPLLSVLLSLSSLLFLLSFFFFYFGPITFSCSDPILNYFPFSKLLNSRQTERHYRLRWEKTGRWFKVYFITPQGILRRKEVIIRPCLKDLTYRMKPSLCNLSVLNHTGSRVHYNTSLQSGWAPWKQVEPWEWDLKQKKTLKPRQLRLVVLF